MEEARESIAAVLALLSRCRPLQAQEENSLKHYHSPPLHSSPTAVVVVVSLQARVMTVVVVGGSRVAPSCGTRQQLNSSRARPVWSSGAKVRRRGPPLGTDVLAPSSSFFMFTSAVADFLRQVVHGKIRPDGFPPVRAMKSKLGVTRISVHPRNAA